MSTVPIRFLLVVVFSGLYLALAVAARGGELLVESTRTAKAERRGWPNCPLWRRHQARRTVGDDGQARSCGNCVGSCQTVEVCCIGRINRPGSRSGSPRRR
jgi:hypothetical protein